MHRRFVGAGYALFFVAAVIGKVADEINRQYQKMTHVKLVDTTGSKRRKEAYEKQLADIEADIKKLNKLYVFVD